MQTTRRPTNIDELIERNRKDVADLKEELRHWETSDLSSGETTMDTTTVQTKDRIRGYIAALESVIAQFGLSN